MEADELGVWKQSQTAWSELMAADVRRRIAGESAVTEEQLDETRDQLRALHAKFCRPDQFKGDLAGAAPPVVVDDLAQQPGAEDEELLALAAARPVAGCTGATDAHIALGDPWGLAGSARANPRVFQALQPFDARLTRARLSRTEFLDAEDFRSQILPTLALVGSRAGAGDALVLTYGIYSVWHVSCRMVRVAGSSLQLAGYVFVATRVLGRA